MKALNNSLVFVVLLVLSAACSPQEQPQSKGPTQSQPSEASAPVTSESSGLRFDGLYVRNTPEPGPPPTYHYLRYVIGGMVCSKTSPMPAEAFVESLNQDTPNASCGRLKVSREETSVTVSSDVGDLEYVFLSITPDVLRTLTISHINGRISTDDWRFFQRQRTE